MNTLEPRDHAAIDAVLADIEAQRQIVERDLMHASGWRGPIRRELHGRDFALDRQRYAAAFDSLAKSPERASIDVALVLRLHDQVVGGDAFREGGVRVGEKDSLPHPQPADIPEQVAEACARASQNGEAPPLAAARLHLAMCSIHPFADGNGRVARLVASVVLLQAGYRSTLLTGVEQHFHADPGAYGRAFRTLIEGGGETLWLLTALAAMHSHSELAAWMRRREERLRSVCDGLSLHGPELERALADFDLGRGPATDVAARLEGKETPLYRVLERMNPRAAGELVYQLQRMSDEGTAERSEVGAAG